MVIVQSSGSSKGNVITSYGNSGAAIFGGSPNDSGKAISHDAIINGNIPTPKGDSLPPSEQIYP